MSTRRFGELFKHWKILRGDKARTCGGPYSCLVRHPASHVQVKIIAGKDKGQVGTVARVLRDQNRVVVEGFNLVRVVPSAFCGLSKSCDLVSRQVKKHIKRTEQQQGGIVTIEAPLHVSNVALVDPVTGCATTARRLVAMCRAPD